MYGSERCLNASNEKVFAHSVFLLLFFSYSLATASIFSSETVLRSGVQLLCSGRIMIKCKVQVGKIDVKNQPGLERDAGFLGQCRHSLCNKDVEFS